MFRHRSEAEYSAGSEGGVRNLFTLGPYEFHDTMDGEEVLHHFILESAEDGEPFVYEIDQPTMYEFMARFLAGEYEMREYQLERSPGHEALLDLLEMATARARGGEFGFSWDQFDHGDTEVLDGGPPEPEDDEPRGG
jgi:hypothetical protein